MTYKALQGMAPNYLSEFFKTSHKNTYKLRSNDWMLFLSKTNTNFLKSSFLYRGDVSWNSLLLEVIDKYDKLLFQSFKAFIRNHHQNYDENK